MERSFRPAEHVRRRADFEKAYEAGSRANGRYMTLIARMRGDGPARLGIAATRKIGSAVVRNRAKRLVRELFRHRKPAAGLDVVVIPRREFLDAPFANLEREFVALLEQARVAKPGRRPEIRRRGARRAGSHPRV